MKIATPSNTKKIIDKYGFHFKKNYGQNFLIDLNIINNIIKTSNITKCDTVLEIGSGIGSLTQALAEASKKVISVEIDKTLIPILKETLSDYSNIDIINGDILNIDIFDLIGKENIKVVANLPYYITTPIIMELIKKRKNIQSITVMIQKEVAQRIQAKQSNGDYGALSIAVQYYCNSKIDIIVPRSCFIPKPNVDSAVISLEMLDSPCVNVYDEKLFFDIVKCGFGQRRKTLTNSISNQLDPKISKNKIAEIISECGFSENIRAEQLSIYDFAKLSNVVYKNISII